jgi:serine/threonine-protein kinase PpkA
VARFNGLAEQRMASAQVSLPAEDSALGYFRQALSLAPEDPTALAGIQRVADWHLQAVHDAYAKSRFATALEHIELGLQAQPAHAELLKLRAAHASYVRRAIQRQQARAAKARPAGKAPAAGSSEQKSTEKEGNPLTRLWNHILNNGIEE